MADTRKPDAARPDAVAPSHRRALWRRITALYHHVLCIVLVAALVLLTIPVSMQIVSRFTNLIPHYIWTEEMARFMFVWVIMIGAMIAVRENSHLDVDVWPHLSSRKDAVLRLFARFAMLLMAFVFVHAGIEFTSFAWHRISELAELPLWLIHIAWPMAGITWLIFLAEHIYDDILVLLGRAPPPPSHLMEPHS